MYYMCRTTCILHVKTLRCNTYVAHTGVIHMFYNIIDIKYHTSITGVAQLAMCVQKYLCKY